MPWARFVAHVVALVALFTAWTCESVVWAVIAFVASVLTIVL